MAAGPDGIDIPSRLARPAVLATAVPFLFLHVHYQPDLGFSAGGTHVGISLSDLAVLAVAVAAVAAGAATGFQPLRRGLPVWIAAAVLLAIVLVSLSYPASARRAVRLARATRVGAEVLRVRGARAGRAAAAPPTARTRVSCSARWSAGAPS